MKKVVGMLGVAALMSSSLVMAGGPTNAPVNEFQGFQDNGVSGAFVGGNFGYAKQDATVVAPLTSKNLRGYAWNIDTGYQINQYWGFELGYTRFAGVSYVATVPGTIRNAQLYGIDLLATGTLPINDQFNLFAKAGAMDMFGKPTQPTEPAYYRSRIVPEFGVGMGYGLTRHWTLILQGITTLSMNSSSSGSAMPATYAGYIGARYKL